MKGLDIEHLTKITGKAIEKTAGLLSEHEGDPMLRKYKRLKPEHFKQLEEKFGARKVQDYIKEMEARSLGVKD